MTSRTLRQQLIGDILGLCAEDDFGLWEVLWYVEGRLPGKEKGSARVLVADALRELVKMGHVLLAQRIGPNGPTRPLLGDEVEAVFSEERFWSEPIEGATQILVGATKDGERFYYSAAHRTGVT
jgi:hypothetical protein